MLVMASLSLDIDRGPNDPSGSNDSRRIADIPAKPMNNLRPFHGRSVADDLRNLDNLP